MNKIRIYCRCDGIRLADLSINLKKGESVIISEAQAKASADLQLAVSVGGVSTRLLKGPSVLREKPKSKKPRFERTPPPPKPPVVLEPKQPSEAEKMREMLETVLVQHRESIEKMVSNITDTLLKSSEGQGQKTASIDIAAIEAVVKTAIQGVALPTATLGTSSSISSVDSGPMFIPEGIVVDTNTDLGAAEESSGFSVDEATEALRAMKKTRKSKKKGG